MWTRAKARGFFFWGLGQGLAPWGTSRPPSPLRDIYSKMMSRAARRDFLATRRPKTALTRDLSFTLTYGLGRGFAVRFLLRYRRGRR